MKPNEIRELDIKELKEKSAELNEELFNLQFQHSTGQLENPMRLKSVRRDIARVKTIIQEMKLSGAEE
jgi:large subunit ribosomal protein L29